MAVIYVVCIEILVAHVQVAVVDAGNFNANWPGMTQASSRLCPPPLAAQSATTHSLSLRNSYSTTHGPPYFNDRDDLLTQLSPPTMSMAQSPTISIPKKKTDDVDWTGPIRQVISHSYGESPDTYSSECAALQRCRQDAVKGAGSDITGQCSYALSSRYH